LGYEGVQVTFDVNSPWKSLIWLTVAKDAPESVGAIARTVRSVEPRAERIRGASPDAKARSEVPAV
jgi:hypothetical protein